MVLPVLKLPSVALQQVLLGFTSTDLFEMHQCSKQTGFKLKQIEKYNKIIKISVDFQRFSVEIRGVRRYQVYPIEGLKGKLPEKTRKFGGREVPIDESDKHDSKVYFKEAEEIEGVMLIATDFIRALGVTLLESVFIGENTAAQEVIQWLQDNKLNTQNFDILEIADDNKDFLAQAIYSEEFFRKVSINFASLLETSPDFTPKILSENGAITLFKLQLKHAKWFTLDHLMTFNSGIVSLEDSTLSSKDVNKFLSLWLKESVYTRLEYLLIKLTFGIEFDIKEIIMGVADPEKIRVEHGTEIVEIKRKDRAGSLTVSSNKKELILFLDDVAKA